MTQTKVGDPSENIVWDAIMIELNETMVPLGDDNPLPVSMTPSGTQDVNLIQVGGATLALGQALAAASVPVVLTAAQISTLTPPDAITGFATEAKQDSIITELQLKANLDETQPVSLATNTPVGNVAHDAADSGAPIKTGGRSRTSEIAAVANDDRTDAIFDKVGKQITMPYALPENFVSGAITSAMTGTTSTSLVAAPAGSLRNYITTIIVSNAHATIGTDVVIQDGNSGTTLMTIPAAAVYGGAVINLPVPLRQPTTATAIYCANVTTGASTKVSAVWFTGL